MKNTRKKKYITKTCGKRKNKRLTKSKLKYKLKSKTISKTKVKNKTKKYKSRGGSSAIRYMVQDAIHSGSNALNAFRGIEPTPNPLPWKDQFNF
jgi:hypothetical protein